MAMSSAVTIAGVLAAVVYRAVHACSAVSFDKAMNRPRAAF
jgi:hypothetical protein